MLKIWRKTLLIIGLLHPIVVTSDNILIAGARRLAAVKALGWEEVPVTVIDLQEIPKGAFAENTRWSPSPDALEPLERQRAKQRQGERRFPISASGCAPITSRAPWVLPQDPGQGA